jgi:hypothetical protein
MGKLRPEIDEFAEDPVLDVLLADYIQGREDDRSFLVMNATLFTIGIPLVAGASSLIFKSCSSEALKKGTCNELPHWAFSFVPLLPLLLVGLFVLNASAAVMRGYYLRGLERELERYGAELRIPGMSETEKPMPSPSLIRFFVPMLSHRRGVFPNAIVQSLLYVVMGMLAVGVSVAAIWRIHDLQLQLWASVFYGLCTAAFATIAIRTGLRSRSFRRTLIDQLANEHARDDTLASGERSLGSYLLIPRPLDLVKVAFITAGALLSYFVAPDSSRTSIWLVVAFILAFELLVYQARYMRNDFRDRYSDPDHPLASAKRRPPALVGHRDRLVWFEGAFVARLFGAVLFVLWLLLTGHNRTAAVFVGGSILICVAAEVYERLKDRAKVQRSPLPFARGRWQTALFLWVGLGYGLRTAIGIAAGSGALDLNAHSAGVVAFVLSWGVLFGAMFVTMSWALESSAFIPRGRNGFDQRLERRAHLAALGTEAGLIKPDAASIPDAVERPGRPGSELRHALRPRRDRKIPPSVLTAWSLAYLAALYLSAFVGVEVASDWRPSGAAYGAAAVAGLCLVVIAALLVVVRAPAAWHWLLMLAAAVALPVVGLVTHVQHGYLLGLAAAAVAALYAFFLNVSYYELTHPQQAWAIAAIRLGAFFERAFLGDGELEMKWRALKMHAASMPAIDD